MRVSLTVVSLAIGLIAVMERGVADEPAAKSAREQYEALVQAQREAQAEFSRAYQAATTKEEKDKAIKALGAKSQARNFSDDFLKLTEKYPHDPVAFDALKWLVSRDNAGPSTRTALANISDEVIKSERMGELCELAGHGFIGREGDSLLNRLVQENPHRQVQAAARFAQAERLARNFERTSTARGQSRPEPPRDAARAGIAEGYRADTLRQIEEILRDVSDKYGDLEHFPGTYKDAAEGKLFEITHLNIGCVAPEIVGVDLDGKPLKLSDFRGKVVLLDYWGTWCGPCMAEMPKYREILARLEGQPFAVVGIDKDQDRETVKKVVVEKQITWPCFWDGPEAPITNRWNVNAWPTLYLIDAAGVIRYKGSVLRSRSVRKNAKGENEPYDLIDDCIDTLMKEMLAAAGNVAK